MYVNSELSTLYRMSKGTSINIIYKGSPYHIEPSDANYPEAEQFYNNVRLCPKADRDANLKNGAIPLPSFFEAVSTVNASTEEVKTEPQTDMKAALHEGLEKLLNFFTEFDFTPSYRFTNTLAYKLNNNLKSAKDYISNYFSLTSSCYKEEIKQKMQSKEFTELIDKIKQFGVPSQHINNRFKVYYGAAGTGKTTLAQNETDNRCIVCNASMLPSDLMENFIFRDGKPDFDPSMLWECMEQGKSIVLDEINLLPFDSLRFLQGIVDGKTSFIYKNREVHIHEGFKIIGTMNLTLGGVTYGLPEPLVDRCEDIREFILSAEQLMGAVTGEFVAG